MERKLPGRQKEVRQRDAFILRLKTDEKRLEELGVNYRSFKGGRRYCRNSCWRLAVHAATHPLKSARSYHEIAII